MLSTEFPTTAKRLTGWGRTRRAEVAACRPERAPAAVRTLGTRYDNGILAYGRGRSYGDAPLNGGGNDGKSQAAAMNLAARTAPEPIGDAVAVLGPDAGSLVANLDGHR